MRKNTDFTIGDRVWYKQGLCRPVQAKVRALDEEGSYSLWLDTDYGVEHVLADEVFKECEINLLIKRLRMESYNLDCYAEELEKYL